MNNEKYEAVVGAYTFMLVDDNTVEIWTDLSSPYADSFIYLKDGEVKSKKDFDMEIMAWYSRNSN